MKANDVQEGQDNKTSTSVFLKAPLNIHQIDQNLPKWTTLLQIYEGQKMTYRRCRAATQFCPSDRVKVWQGFLVKIENSSDIAKIRLVNNWINALPYRNDSWIYSQKDHWAEISEFLKYSGDCEDFAIAKYISLRELGFNQTDLKITMVYDVYSGTDHAFLVVRHNGQDYFLDNREKDIQSAEFLKRYRPHYAFNEKQIWTFNNPVMARAIRRGNKTVQTGNR